MAALETGYRCVVICPDGILLDERVRSVIFPAHDGLVGVLKGHMPMFCQLGMGLLEAEVLPEHASHPVTRRMLLDGGFVVMCQDLLKIVSYDAVDPEQVSGEQCESLRRRIRRAIDSASLDQGHRQHLQRKLALLDRITPTAESR